MSEQTTTDNKAGKNNSGGKTRELPFTPPRWLIPWISRTHIALYKLTAGKIGGKLAGFPGILIRTFGRKSGKPHTVCLPCIEDGDNLIVVASYAGADKDPDWLKNIKVKPNVIIRSMEKTYWANAKILSGTAHDKIWKMVVEQAPWYADYQEKTERKIPLVSLSFDRPYIG